MPALKAFLHEHQVVFPAIATSRIPRRGGLCKLRCLEQGASQTDPCAHCGVYVAVSVLRLAHAADEANPRSCTWTCALNKNFRSCVPADFDFQAAHEPLQRYTPGRNKLRRPEGGDTTFERHLLRTPTHQLPDSRPAAAAVHHQHAPAEPSAARTEHTYAIAIREILQATAGCLCCLCS